MKTLSIAALVAVLLGAGMPAWADAGIRISDPYARILAGNGVVYFTIDNRQAQSDQMIAARSDAGMAMLMTSAQDAAGVMRMRMLPDGIAVAAGTAHALAPAADHVMLSGVMGRYKTGDTITLTVTFATAGEVTLTVPVDNTRRTPPGPGPTAFDAMSVQGADSGAAP